MFIDSSAIVEILTDAPKAEEMLLGMQRSIRCYTGPTVLYETAVVLSTRLDRPLPETKRLVERFLDDFAIEVLSADRKMANHAIDAFARYGKGRHPARLNFGDCFSYAGAKAAGVPLLYVGGDFALTDLA